MSVPTSLRDAATGSTAVAARTIDAVKQYGRAGTAVRALDGVTLDVPAGRFTAIMGPSGSGKSTLMHCLAGLDTLSSGRVLLGGVDLGTLSDAELTRLRRERVGFVFQSFNLVPTLTAAENITLPLRMAGARPDAASPSRRPTPAPMPSCAAAPGSPVGSRPPRSPSTRRWSSSSAASTVWPGWRLRWRDRSRSWAPTVCRWAAEARRPSAGHGSTTHC